MKYSMLCIGKELLGVGQMKVSFDFDLPEGDFHSFPLRFPMTLKEALNFQIGDYYELKIKMPK
jgi:hypothetical protein